MKKMKKTKGKVFQWRMPAPCDHCPFEPGPLRESLLRLPEIEKAVLAGEAFLCHKTTKQTGNNTNLVCAGAINLQHQHGYFSPFEQICTRLEGIQESKTTILHRLKGLMKVRR